MGVWGSGLVAWYIKGIPVGKFAISWNLPALERAVPPVLKRP